MNKKKNNLISLLTGRIKAAVNKGRKKNTNKLIIKTKTAAMGVRGTSFQVTFNTENKITSLVTFEGKVALAKIDKKTKIEQINKILKTKEAVIVKKGRYSSVSANLKKSTTPIKISPLQYTMLKLNKTFLPPTKLLTEETIRKEVEKTKKEFTRLDKKKETPQDHFNPESGRYRPKAGGHIDLETGFYIPPAKDSVIDKKLNIFIEKKPKKSVDSIGDYVPPAGVKLDSKKGFMADKESGTEVTMNVEKLNQQIAPQIVKPTIPTKNYLEDIESNAYEKYFKIP